MSDTVTIEWVFNPNIRKQGRTEDVDAGEAKVLVRTGRARYVEPDTDTAEEPAVAGVDTSNDAANTAASQGKGEPPAATRKAAPPKS